MQFDPPLEPATLIRRYKRFLADIVLEDGRTVTCHVANSGTMLGVAPEGGRIWVQPATNPKRKLQWSWYLTEFESGMVGVDTGVPNRIVGEALQRGEIAGLEAQDVRPEQRYGTNSRIDFLLNGDTYVEVKNVHLMRRPGLAEFPDCVTSRGTKHLNELAEMARSGRRAVMLYVVQRTDCTEMQLAADLDPAYAAAFADALAAGVEAMALGTEIDTRKIRLGGPMPMLDAMRA